MSYSQDRAVLLINNFSHLIPELHRLYWETREFIDPIDPSRKILKFAFPAEEIAKKFNLPNAYAVRFLIAGKNGPLLGSCDFCGETFYAKNRTEYQAQWYIKKPMPCGHVKACKCGKYALKKWQNECEECHIKSEKKSPPASHTPEPDLEVFDDLQESNFQGPYVQSWRIINNRVSDQFFWIKLTEIKQIQEHDGGYCSFNTYKDCHYFIYLSRQALIKAINYFLFKPDEFADTYVAW